MYTAKQAILYKHRVHSGQPYIFYIDIRAGGKGYEEFINRAQQDGVVYLRGKVSKIYRDGDKVMVWGSDTLSGRKVEIAADLVILSMAAVPAISANGQRVPGLALALDENGFYQSSDAELAPMESNLPGVFLAGAGIGPKDIPETVAQASGAAAKVLGMFRQALR